MPVKYGATARLEFIMGYACSACRWTGRGVVQGRGSAEGSSPGEYLSEAAQGRALKNAEMRCELARCPGCGKRGWSSFLDAWGRLARGVLLVPAICLVSMLIGERNHLEGQLSGFLWMTGALAGLLELGVLMVLAFDLRAAARVRFLEEEPEDQALGPAYRSPPESLS